MRIALTDKFLWDLYTIFEKAKKINKSLSAYYIRKNLFSNPEIEHYVNERGRREFQKFIYYLKGKNYIRIKNLEGKQAVLITKKGISKALRASFEVDKKRKRKDGKWIMLMFDIPQTHKKARILMNSILENLGYKMFQHSVWVSPYDISDETEKLLQIHNLDRYVKIFLIEKI